MRRPGFGAFIGESLGNFFSFDSKFFRTIYLLFKYPGKVALDYKQGKRIRYMPPVRIYFLVSVILLFIMNIDGDGSTTDNVNVNNQEVLDSLGIAQNQGTDSTADESDFEVSFDSSQAGQSLERMYVFAKNNPKLAVDDALDSLDIEQSGWNRFTYGQMKKAFNMEPEEFTRYLNSKIFWILFCFLPLFAVWLKLVYWRRDFHYLEHLHFAFYTQTAFFLLLTLAAIVDLIVVMQYTDLVAIIIFAGYLFIALRKFYRQGVMKSILKFIILNLGFALFALFFMILALITTYVSY